MNTLITGSNGFIGTNMLSSLRPGNYVPYDITSGQDIRDKYKLEDYFQKLNFDTVIHLAARAGVRMGQQYPKEFVSTNVYGTNNLLELSLKYGVKHFIFFSSSSIYGNQTPPNNENSPLTPVGIYGTTKAMGEMLVQSSGVPYTIIRPFTVYGENGRLDQVMFKWIQQIRSGRDITVYGDGTSKRGYTYVGDLVDGVMKVLDKGAENEVYNLGGNEVIKLDELVELFQPYLEGKKDRISILDMPKEDVYENWGDISKAKERLGWEPKTDFKKKVTEILKSELKSS